MNREIKFRAWDIGKKVFIPVEYWAVISNSDGATAVMLKDWEDYKEGEYFYPYNSTITQYTGLKDKNGTEIYEGDVCGIFRRKKYGHQSEGQAIAGVVEFGQICIQNNSLYVFDAFHIGGRSIKDLLGNELEIIGNIYQQPHLNHPL